MDSDDAQVGRLLSRREALALLGVTGASVLGGTLPLLRPERAYGVMLPACVVRPAQTEGPYFIDEKLNRSDIRTDPVRAGVTSEGARLDLTFQVSQLGGQQCQPLAGAVVDVWQCDALGIYSDVRDIGGRFNTVGQKFLRGHQVTDAKGNARFVTIYPGWYEGRTVHIHFKIRTASVAGRAHEFTSQLYFDDALTNKVMQLPPYASKGLRTMTNQRDGIFRRGGDQLMLAVVPKGKGYSGVFDVGLQIG